MNNTSPTPSNAQGEKQLVRLSNTDHGAMKLRSTLNRLHKRNGFTLIELLVVIVILAILMAIAIPSYLSQQKKAKDITTQHALQIAFRSGKADAVENNDKFFSASPLVSKLLNDQPQLSAAVGNKATAVPNQVVVDPATGGDTMILYAHSDSNVDFKQVCYYTKPCDPVVNLGPHVSSVFSVGTPAALTTGGTKAGFGYLNWSGTTILSNGSGATAYSLNAATGATQASTTAAAASLVGGSTTRIVGRIGGFIKAINTDGTGAVTIYAASGYHPHTSPDGTKVAFTGLPGGYLRVANTDGTNVVQIAASGADWEPQFIDSSTLVYYDNSAKVIKKVLLNANNTVASTSSIASGITDADTYPVISPSGTKIAYTDTVGGKESLIVMNTDGSGSTVIADSTKTSGQAVTFGQELAWSPDSSTLAFETDNGTANEGNVWVILADGTSATQVSPSGATSSGYYPAFSPDGATLAYVNDLNGTGSPDIYKAAIK
jgi:type IV pilus assembly protein PilA